MKHFRLIRNPIGSSHPEATLKACIEHGAPEDAIQAAQAEFHAHLAQHRSAQSASSHDLVEDAELAAAEDREMDADNQGKDNDHINIDQMALINVSSFVFQCRSTSAPPPS